jgi:hypothetical protein
MREDVWLGNVEVLTCRMGFITMELDETVSGEPVTIAEDSRENI